jgi:hypothetical protein
LRSQFPLQIRLLAVGRLAPAFRPVSRLRFRLTIGPRRGRWSGSLRPGAVGTAASFAIRTRFAPERLPFILVTLTRTGAGFALANRLELFGTRAPLRGSIRVAFTPPVRFAVRVALRLVVPGIAPVPRVRIAPVITYRIAPGIAHRTAPRVRRPRWRAIVRIVRLDDVVEPLADRHAGAARRLIGGGPRFGTKTSEIPRTARFHSRPKPAFEKQISSVLEPILMN